MTQHRGRSRTAFTLIELLVVIAIIAVISALIMPAISRSRAMASRMECQSRLARLSIALFNYHDSHLTLPPGTVSDIVPVRPDASQPQFAWTTRLLRELDMPQTYRAVDFSKSVYAAENDRLHALDLRPFICPVADPENGVSYVGNQHHEPKPITGEDSGLFFNNSRIDLSEIPDGRSSTLMLGETVVPAPVSWASGTRAVMRYARLGEAGLTPQTTDRTATSVREGRIAEESDESLETASLSSRHGDFALAAMADGRVLPLSYRMDTGVLSQIANREDGEPIAGFE